MEANCTSGLHYEGKVTIEVINNRNKVVSHREIKNTGRWPLFYFLTQCLAGNYEDFNSNRPVYLRLFTIGAVGAALPTNKDIEANNYLNDNKLSSANSFYPNDASVTKIVKDVETGESSTVTFSYMCPYTQLDTSKPINLIALYSAANKNDLSNSSAYIVVEGTTTDNKPNGKLGTLIPTDTSNKNNYTLSIKWQLTIKN